MFNLFKMGGPLFMGILTGILFLIVLLAAFYLVIIVRKDYKDINTTRSGIAYIKNLGVLSLIMGMLAQCIGLYQAFSMIEKAKDVSPVIMLGGLKISMITPMYGMMILIIAYLLWFITDYLASREA